MNKTELIDRVTEATALPKHYVFIVLDVIFDLIGESIISGDTVKIRNFGTFKSVDRDSRTGVNPRTKEPIDIPASTAIKFVAATKLVEDLNN